MKKKEKEYITIKKEVNINAIILSNIINSIRFEFKLDDFVNDTFSKLDAYLCDNYILNFPEHPEIDFDNLDLEDMNYELICLLSKPKN